MKSRITQTLRWEFKKKNLLQIESKVEKIFLKISTTLNSLPPCPKCLNGYCVYLINIPRCICACHYNGSFCEICKNIFFKYNELHFWQYSLNYLDNNPCNSNPCLNQGFCFPYNYTCKYACQCAPGYSGFNCEISKIKMSFIHNIFLL